MQDQLKTVICLSKQWISSRSPLLNQKNINENMHTVDKIVKFVNKAVIFTRKICGNDIKFVSVG